MDDLSGLDWSSKPAGNQSKPPPMNNAFPSLKPSPSPFGSGRTTPASNQGSTASGPFAKPAPPKPAQDSFSNLVNFGAAKPAQNLTLAERQAQLEAEKRKKEEEKRKLAESQFGSGSQWDSLGSRGTPSPALRQPTPASTTFKNDDDDLFAAFNKDTKVDKSSHYPPPESKHSTPANGTQLDLTNPSAWATSSTGMGSFAAEDDDPFGLNELKPNKTSAATMQQPADDDDFLGDLGKPVEEVRRNRPTPNAQPEPGKPIEDDDSSSSEDERPSRRQPSAKKPSPGGDAFDHAVAQLMDYGFSPEDARRGLTESGAGTNVQQAANWLLDDAHRKAKAKAQGRSSSSNSNRTEQRPERREHSQQGRSEPDFAKSAAAVGSSLFKTANSLWKTGQKKMQQAVSDFQQEGGGDPNQPKWMRDAQAASRQTPASVETNATDEARMLDSGARPKPSRTSSKQPTPQMTRDSSPAQSSAGQSRSSTPKWQQQAAPSLVSSARSRLNRFADDDDFAMPVSANRRRKPTTPAEPVKSEPEPDLLFGGDSAKPSQALSQRPAQQQAAQSPAPAQAARRAQPAPPPRKAAPPRQIPSISPDALQRSAKHRLEGTAHFKRGDYATAHSSYSSSLSAVPAGHPLTIILLTNRALTALKTGEPKQAVSDADEAIKVIGPSFGQNETVAVTTESGQEEKRDMRDLYGKALSRKAEALEQMEKWAEAGAVWQTTVEAGLGGATAIKGRQRCQNALKPKPKAAPKPAAKPPPRPSASASLAPQKDSEAVTRLRAANEAAAKEDDEKFALSEKVDAKVAAWRDGKRDNLRALVASLDKVLWEGSGWKTVGLHELVMANKVKISYMKAIAKTHPDKVRLNPLLI